MGFLRSLFTGGVGGGNKVEVGLGLCGVVGDPTKSWGGSPFSRRSYGKSGVRDPFSRRSHKNMGWEPLFPGDPMENLGWERLFPEILQ